MAEHQNESGVKLSEIERLATLAHNLSSSVKFWNRLNIICVAGAVVLAAFVFITQFLASKKSDELATVQESIIAEKDSAAQEDSKVKDGKIADALKQAGKSNENAVLSLERQSALRIELIKQQGKTAIAEKTLLEVRQKLRYRSVSPEQKAAFLSATYGAEKGAVEVSAMSGNAESISYAESLRNLLVDAGWTCDPLKNTLITGDNAIGLALYFDSVEQLEIDPQNLKSVLIPKSSAIYHGLAIKQGFSAAGIPLSRAQSESKSPENKIIIIVGAKP